jgi:chorismate-pyruvate lyase
MRTLDQAIAQGVPETFWRFVRESCGAQPESFRMLDGSAVPEPAKQLLVHRRDMTTTLAEFHGSELNVEIFQVQRRGELYLREVFLRTIADARVVEYGVIAIALEQFTASPRALIEAGRTPLGEVLHRCKIPFVSAPIGFFAVAAQALAPARFERADGPTSYGRFNRLAKPTGEPLAWIMEILPPTHSRS